MIMRYDSYNALFELLSYATYFMMNDLKGNDFHMNYKYLLTRFELCKSPNAFR